MAEEAELIGGRIRELRKARGWTQRELAERMKGHAEGKDISRWENGKHVPEQPNLKALADALETTIADLRAGPLKDRAKPRAGDLAQLNPDVSELMALEAKVDRVLDQVAELAGAVTGLQVTERALREHLQRLDRRMEGSGSD